MSELKTYDINDVVRVEKFGLPKPGDLVFHRNDENSLGTCAANDGKRQVSVLWSRAPREGDIRRDIMWPSKIRTIDDADRQLAAELNAGVTEMTLKAVQQRDPDVIDMIIIYDYGHYDFKFKRDSVMQHDRYNQFDSLSGYREYR
jgi:hypothetical protein